MVEQHRREKTWGTKLSWVLVAMALVCVPWTVSAEEADEVEAMSASELAERVQHYYSETEDFQAAFLQTYVDVAAGETTRSRGRVYFKKPGMMRWDYYKPDAEERDRLLVSDGDVFWVYEFDYQQVFRQCLEDSQLPTALSFLMGEGELQEEFDISLVDGDAGDDPTLELVPKEPTSHYQRIHFTVDPEAFQVSKTTVFDPYGNRNEVEFINVRVNQNISEAGFQFEVPEGARELNPEEECN